MKTQIQKELAANIRRRLLRWYAVNGRTFLWRGERPDPYIVLVSECMLQQTQTARVEQLLPPFLKLFPTVQTLASATNAEVIVAWRGLGYNSRALRLRDCAREIVSKYEGLVPDEENSLRALPGIGKYTASALLSFAFHKNVVVMDVNIRRVYSRVFGMMSSTTQHLSDTALQKLSLMLIARSQSSKWHQAVMDIGALFCKAGNPRCAACPLSKLCRSAHKMKQEQPGRKAEPSHREVPNRIWRGRIIEQLRNYQSVNGLGLSRLLKILIPKNSTSDLAWLHDLLQTLERAELVELKGQRVRLRN